MKIFVVSDIHGSLYYAKKIQELVAKEKTDRVILLGDLYYHGPRNPLTKDYNPMEVCNILNEMKEKITCIRGNCDAEVDEMISNFKFHDNIRENINGKRFFFTHGHKYNMDNLPDDIDVIVYGHFHTGFITKKGDILCVNDGSISLPKNNTKNSYVIITDEEIILKDIEMNIIDKVNYR